MIFHTNYLKDILTSRFYGDDGDHQTSGFPQIKSCRVGVGLQVMAQSYMLFKLALGLWWIGGSGTGEVAFEGFMSRRVRWEMGMM